MDGWDGPGADDAGPLAGLGAGTRPDTAVVAGVGCKRGKLAQQVGDADLSLEDGDDPVRSKPFAGEDGVPSRLDGRRITRRRLAEEKAITRQVRLRSVQGIKTVRRRRNAVNAWLRRAIDRERDLLEEGTFIKLEAGWFGGWNKGRDRWSPVRCARSATWCFLSIDEARRGGDARDDRRRRDEVRSFWMGAWRRVADASGSRLEPGRCVGSPC